MGKRYLIKITSTGTESNPNFVGKVQIHIYARDQHCIAATGTDDDFDRTNIYAKEEGYKRLCDAKRSYFYTHKDEKDSYGYWDEEVEIIEVDC